MSDRRPFLGNLAFPAAVAGFVALSVARPGLFGSWFGLDLGTWITPLVQIITFGMGTTLSLEDFRRVFRMPWAVVVGFALQFSVMPLVGYAIAMTFGFPPEIAAGVILIGSVSGGVASNLVNYLARNNVALSVTMTAFTTLGAPILTPFWMKTLAGRLVPVDVPAMMLSIVDMIIMPILAGLVAHAVLYGRGRPGRPAFVPAAIAAGSAAAAVLLVTIVPWPSGPAAALRGGIVLGLVLIALTAAAKLAVRALGGPENWMDKVLPLVSMAAICLIIAVITSRSRDQLLRSGLLLVGAAVVHNALGYLLGYSGARLLRLNERDARTVAVEVGMQNGGMASGIAMNVLRSPGAALAPAIFGPWMNVSGSLLASYWRRRPAPDPGPHP